MVREKSAVALVSLFAAILLTGTKLTVGLLTNSLGILSEAAHSGLDLVAALVTYIAIRYSDRPADKEHPYGHGKIESVSALFETGILIFTCFWIASEALGRIFGGKAHQIEVNVYSFAVMILSIAVDSWRSRALSRSAKKYNSEALAADALHFSSDIMSSSVVIIGLIGVIIGFEYADPLAALLVAFLVVVASVRLGKKSVDTLLDKAPVEQVERVARAISKVEGVLGFRNLRMRKAGSKTFVDVNIQMNPSLSLEQAHTVSENIETMISGVLPQSDTVVHMEPLDDKRVDIFDRLILIAHQQKLNIYNITVQKSEGDQFRISAYLQLPSEMSLPLAHTRSHEYETKVLQEIPQVNEIRIHIESMDRSTRVKPRDVTEKAPHLTRAVESLAHSIPGVIKVNKITIEQQDDRYTIFLNCQVGNELLLNEAHEIANEIEKTIYLKIPRVREVFVHTEPSGM